MLIQNTKKSPGVEAALFNLMGEMGMNTFGCFSFLALYLFCNEPVKKKNYGVRTLAAEPPPPLIRASTLLAGPTLPPSESTYM